MLTISKLSLKVHIVIYIAIYTAPGKVENVDLSCTAVDDRNQCEVQWEVQCS